MTKDCGIPVAFCKEELSGLERYREGRSEVVGKRVVVKKEELSLKEKRSGRSQLARAFFSNFKAKLQD